MRVQLGVRLTRSARLPVEELLHIAHRVAFEHIIDRPGQLMSQDRQRLPLAVLFLSAGQIFLARRMGVQEQDRRFGEGPLQGGVPDLRA